MNRQFKLKALSMLVVLLMAQPAAHCFTFNPGSYSFPFNPVKTFFKTFNTVKPYVTFENTIKTTFCTGAVAGLAYVLYSAYNDMQKALSIECVLYPVSTRRPIQDKLDALIQDKFEALDFLRKLLHDLDNHDNVSMDTCLENLAAVRKPFDQNSACSMKWTELCVAIEAYYKDQNDQTIKSIHKPWDALHCYLRYNKPIKSK